MKKTFLIPIAGLWLLCCCHGKENETGNDTLDTAQQTIHGYSVQKEGSVLNPSGKATKKDSRSVEELLSLYVKTASYYHNAGGDSEAAGQKAALLDSALLYESLLKSHRDEMTSEQRATYKKAKKLIGK